MIKTVHDQRKIAEIDKKRRQTAKHSTSYTKSMPLNPFPVTDLRPEIELMHVLCKRIVINRWHWTDSEFA